MYSPETTVLCQLTKSRDNSYSSPWDNDSWKSQEMKFGKYRGELLEFVAQDKKYCTWMKNNLKHKPGPVSYLLFVVQREVPTIELNLIYLHENVAEPITLN